MRSLPPWVWLLFALLFGTGASLMALSWLRGHSPPPAPVAVKSAKVVVAKRDISGGTRLNAADMKVDEWHQETAPKGSFANVGDVEGRIATYPFSEGELITEKKLAPKGATQGLTALLPPHKRAMTVKVDEASGVAGFVFPQNRVDVVVTVDKGEFSKNPVAKVIFQNLKVLGIGQKIENKPGDQPQVVPTVTLEVTPEEGERLALAAQEGRISLVLRGPEDIQLVDTTGADAGRLFGSLPGASSKAAGGGETPAPAPPPGRRIEVIRGLQREPVNF